MPRSHGFRRIARPGIATTVAVLAATTLASGCRATAGAAPPGTGPTSSVSGAAVWPTGTSAHSLTVGGMTRTYQVYRPASAPASQPLPLVVFLHGAFGNGAQAERSYGWDALADREHIVIAYPDGIGRAWNVGGGCCGRPGQQNIDDVGFVTAVVAAVRAATTIDPRRVYATGISNGGMLDYRLACDTSLFAAIGPDSATLLGPCPHPAPVSVVQVHGTADQRIRYAGGPGSGVGRIDGPPVPELVARWRAVDRCVAPDTITRGPVTTSTATCPDGRAVELVTIAGAGHQWPGSRAQPAVERAFGLDPPSAALDATATIWAFFAAHPRPA